MSRGVRFFSSQGETQTKGGLPLKSLGVGGAEPEGHQGSFDMYVFRQATWFDGRYFAMPLRHSFGSWLVGVMPE